MTSPSKQLTDTRVVLTSLAVSVSDIVLNLLLAMLTGSVVLLTQALQGSSDLMTAGILYVGVRRSRRSPDLRHPFGYGREIFFWSMMAGLMMFLGTGLASIYFGYQQWREPEIIDYPAVALGMLVFGAATNAYAFSRSVKRMNQVRGVEAWWRRFVRSSMIETKATFLVDFMGALAAVLGLIALVLFVLTGDARYDGLGGMVIGLSMMLAALLLLYDVRGLIVGRAVPETTARHIRQAALEVPEVTAVLDLKTMHLGSADILVLLEVHLRDELDTDGIEAVTDTIKHRVQLAVPRARWLQVEVETPDSELAARGKAPATGVK